MSAFNVVNKFTWFEALDIVSETIKASDTEQFIPGYIQSLQRYPLRIRMCTGSLSDISNKILY